VESLEENTREDGADSLDKTILLADPHVLDELAVAARVALGETVGLVAGQRKNLVGILVADKGAETALVGRLPTLAVAELSAAGEATAFVGAVIPLLEDLVGLVLVLHDHETSVEEQVVLAVAVVLGVGVVGERHGVVLGVDAPVGRAC